MVNSLLVNKVLKMAKLSEVAYLREADLISEAKKFGFSEVRYIQRQETQLFVAKNDSELLLCFRGTEPDKVEDIFTDLRCKQVPWIYGKVHQGFSEAYRLIEDEILSFCQEDGFPKKILVTGHSLGGALATITALSLRCQFPQFHVEVITFGCPKVGNKDFVKEYERLLAENSIRVVNDEDGVAKVPLALMDFHHAEDLYYLTDDCDFIKIPNIAWIARNAIEVGMEIFEASQHNDHNHTALKKAMIENAKELGSDHLISSYIANLEKALSKLLVKNQKNEVTV